MKNNTIYYLKKCHGINSVWMTKISKKLIYSDRFHFWSHPTHGPFVLCHSGGQVTWDTKVTNLQIFSLNKKYFSLFHVVFLPISLFVSFNHGKAIRIDTVVLLPDVNPWHNPDWHKLTLWTCQKLHSRRK